MVKEATRGWQSSTTENPTPYTLSLLELTTPRLKVCSLRHVSVAATHGNIANIHSNKGSFQKRQKPSRKFHKFSSWLSLALGPSHLSDDKRE